MTREGRTLSTMQVGRYHDAETGHLLISNPAMANQSNHYHLICRFPAMVAEGDTSPEAKVTIEPKTATEVALTLFDSF